MIDCYAFRAVPPAVQGLVRDLRVRWALEEVGVPYRTTLLGIGAGALPPSAYRTIQPFGQVPAIRDANLTLFESGAIVLHVAERGGGLLPDDPSARAHVIQWMFAALNTIEPRVDELAAIDLFHADQPWAKERRPGVVDGVRVRLTELASCLDGRDHLVGSFTAADILMTSVLRTLRHTDLLAEHPVLVAYKEGCEARPAFGRALAAHMADFDDHVSREGQSQ
jgi:glutathione S-transferase